jgi:glutaredoxin
MASIVKIFLDYLNPRKFYLWIFLLILMLLVGGYFVYNRNYNSLKNSAETKNIPNSGTSSDIRIMFFTADWCPHCKQAKTPWNDFKAGYHNKRINDIQISCIEYNMTEKDTDDPKYQEYHIAKGMGDKYKVDGFPTIKMLRGSQVIDYDAKITSFALEKFVENMI